MFRKSKEKDDSIDIRSLNHILKTGNKIINIGYFMAIMCLILVGTYLIKEWHVLKYIKDFLLVISPVFIGFLIAWFFEPLVSWMQNKKIPRLVCCILVYFVIIGGLFLISYLFVPSLVSQLKDFLNAAPDIFESISNFILNMIQKVDTNHIIDTGSVKKELTSVVTEYGIHIGSDMPKYIFAFGKSVVSKGLNFILGLMIGFYLLYDFEKVNVGIYSLIPEMWKDGYQVLIHRINTSLRNYVQGVLMVMLLVFFTQSIGLTLAGMEAPILFAMFCAVTDIIPYFGPYIGGIPAVIVGFTISPVTGICVIISILVVQLLENNFYQPLIMGHTLKLHPVTIILGLLIFQHFLGVFGMVIATPCIACFKVIVVFVMEQAGAIRFLKEKTENIKLEVESKS